MKLINIILATDQVQRSFESLLPTYGMNWHDSMIFWLLFIMAVIGGTVFQTTYKIVKLKQKTSFAEVVFLFLCTLGICWLILIAIYKLGFGGWAAVIIPIAAASSEALLSVYFRKREIWAEQIGDSAVNRAANTISGGNHHHDYPEENYYENEVIEETNNTNEHNDDSRTDQK